MLRRYSSYVEVRLTHVPTGTWAKCSGTPTRNQIQNLKILTQSARSLLAARVARLGPPVLAVVRSYHLNPPLELEPFIGHDRGHGREIAVGLEAVREVLNGKIPAPAVQSDQKTT